jgi:hypothetical protein
MPSWTFKAARRQGYSKPYQTAYAALLLGDTAFRQANPVRAARTRSPQCWRCRVSITPSGLSGSATRRPCGQMKPLGDRMLL